ncbi:hypothetical protein VTN96DRAFT_5574 [Rasamsonia emersonii]
MGNLLSSCFEKKKERRIEVYDPHPLNDNVACGFSDLPTEIVLEIAEYLNPMSKLCLALTCKSLLRILDPDKSLQRSPRFRLQTGEMAAPTLNGIFDLERWLLMRRLEDSRWRCCPRCLKLHPVHDFSETDLAIKAEERNCKFGPMAGTVFVCPCKQITFRDKLRLIDQLKQNSNPPAQLQNGQSSSCWHQCTTMSQNHYHRFPQVQLTINPVLENGDNLVLEVDYHLMGLYFPQDLAFMGLLLCPHRAIDCHLRDLVDIDRGAHWSEGIVNPEDPKWITCKWCHTTMTDAFVCTNQHNDYNDPHHLCITIRARRPLGRAGSCADEVWYHQTDLAKHRLFFNSVNGARARDRALYLERRPDRSWVRPGGTRV